MIFAPHFQYHMSTNYGWRLTSDAGSAVALGTGTETGPGAGQAVVAAGKSPLTGVPGVIPRTPGILGTIDPGMAGGRQMRDATERRTGAVANSPVLTEEMGRTDTQSMIKALLCPLTTSSVRVSTVRSKTWMGSGSNLRILVRPCLLHFLMKFKAQIHLYLGFRV